MALPAAYVSADAVRAMPDDGNRYEVLWGELLVIEVLSPGTARHDRFTKRRLYQEQQIPTVWLVDLDAQLVEVWTPTDVRPTVVRETVTWTAPGASEPLRLDLESLLRTD